MFFVRETKGKSLEEIEEMYRIKSPSTDNILDTSDDTKDRYWKGDT